MTADAPMIPIPTAEERPLLTIRETAEILGVALNTAYAAAKGGNLPTIRIGRQYRVQTAELRTLLGLDQSVPVELPPRHPRLPVSTADRIREARERREARSALWRAELLGDPLPDDDDEEDPFEPAPAPAARPAKRSGRKSPTTSKSPKR